MTVETTAAASRAATVTVLFADAVKPPDQRPGADEALPRRHGVLLEAVAGAGGELLPWVGTGVMATFASASAAVRCAVGMQQRASQDDVRAVGALRIGLNVGEVLREDTGTAYFGTPVVTAKRLCDRAEPGTILCSAAIAGLLGGRIGVGFRDVGLTVMNGLPGAVHVCEVEWNAAATRDEETGRTPGRAPLPALLQRAEQFPFSGRARELEQLVDSWRRAAEGCRVLLIEGEPGIGKTRLVTEAARAVHALGGRVLFGRCDEEMGVPFQPLVEALEHFLAYEPQEGLRSRLGRHAGELVRLVPDLTARVPGLLPPLQSDPETERYRLFDAVARWLAAASATQTILLVIDDIHWAGKPTLLLLRHIVRTVDPARLCIFCTHRDTEVTAGHPLADLLADLRNAPNVERLPLIGLDESGVVEFMQRASGQELDADGLGFARAVRAETAGNPFFVGEVLRHLAESGSIVRADGRWVSAVALADVGIPAAVRDVVLRRVGRLSPSVGEVLLLASVVGRDFDLGVLAQVSPLAEDEVLGALDAATAARLVDETGIDSYRFAHALVRSALYKTLGTSRRSRLHRRVAQAIESRRPDEVTALAYHFAEAGPDQRPQAVRYNTKAGDQAMRGLAHDQAIYFYQRALTLFDDVVAQDPSERCELLARLGEAQRNAGEAVFRETLLEAAQTARRLGDTERLVRAALANNRGWVSTSGAVDRERVEVLEAALLALGREDSPARASLTALLAAELLFAGDRTRRLALSDEALAMARRVGDAATLAYVLNVRGHTIWEPATLRERLANTAEHLALAAQLTDPRARWYALATRLQPCMEAGDIVEVDRCLAALWRLTLDLGQPHLAWAATLDRAWRALLGGDLGAAESLATEAFEAGKTCGQGDAFTYFAGQLLAVRWTQGRLGELVPVLEQAVRENPGIPAFRALLALAYVEDQRPDAAYPLLVAAAAGRFAELPVDMTWTSGMTAWAEVAARLRAEGPAETLYGLLSPAADLVVFNGIYVLGGVARALGLLAGALDRTEAADGHFGAALDLHARLQAPALLARTQLDWGLEHQRRGSAERTRGLLEAARDAAGRLGLTGVGRRAQEALLR